LLSQRLHQLGFHPRSTRVDKPRKLRSCFSCSAEASA
jgi:hypothetical protein